MPVENEQLIRVVANEVFQYRKAVAFAFAGINALAIGIGLSWPEYYTASTTILVQERNIIQPLMQGAAVPTENTGRVSIAREVVYSRKLMQQVLEETGRASADTPQPERDAMVDKLIAQTALQTITNRNIIRLEYKDKDPERSYRTTAKIAELFVAESYGNKAAESTSAFEFIDKQVKEYHDKLMQVEEALKEYRTSNVDARPGTEMEISSRISQIKQTIEQTERQLRETEVRKTSLERQLAGEAETASALTREGQFRARIGELQAQLDTLRLSYHETYPDVVRIKHQIEDLRQSIAEEQVRRETARRTGQSVVDESIVVTNPVYQQLRQQLLATRLEIDTLTARVNEARRQVNQELERGKRVVGGESELAQLTRDYQVNKDLYQDLLRRRESARVSMNLDLEKRGLVFRVHEPPTFPRRPAGPQLLHIAVAGLLLGVLLPVGGVFLIVKFDPRMRLASVIEDRFHLPVLATIPRMWTPGQVIAVRDEIMRLALVAAATFGMVAVFVALRLAKVL